MLWCFLSALRKQDCPGYQLNNSTTFLSWLHALLDPSSLAIRHIDDTQSKGQEVPKQSASAVPALYKARLNKWALETAGNANKARTFRSRWLAGSCIPRLSSCSANTITHNQEWWPLPEGAQQEDPWFNCPSTAPSVLRKQLPTLDCILHKNCPAQKWAKKWRCLPTVFKSLRNRCCHWW